MNDLGLGVVVSMKDAFSRNAHRIQSSMQSLDASVAAASENMTRNLDRIQKGTMMIGAGLAALAIPAALVASTAASQKALGELASLGVRDLRAIENAAESFTNQWAGTSKAEFIGATYDVKSALSSLTDEAVGVFTSMAALTAKATKASTQEMVGTFTSGYGIFKPIMSDMTDMEWATAFSGAMAQTVASFKTNGQQMADAIKNIGAVAASANVPLQEQLAVLGQLQTTMPGSEAGTLYKAFMMKAAEAGDELGLSFTDSTGRLRSVTAILEEIKGLYPDLSKAAAQVELKKAFGSDEALKFVLQMSAGTEALKGNIQSIEKAMKSGTAVTEEMARAMNLDIGSQMVLLRQQMSNLFEIMGRTLLPVVTPLIQGLSRMIVFFQNVARSIPGVTRAALTLTGALGAVLVIAGAVMSAVGLIGVAAPAISAGFAAIGTAAAGVGSAIAAWFWPVTLAIAGVVLAVYLLRKAWTTNFGGIRDAVMGVWNRVSLVFQGIKALVTSLSGDMGQMSAELAGKLEAAGLMGFVVTVFKVYHRVREYLAGLSEAFSHAFGRVRAILEPAVRSLIGAYAALYKAFFSIFEVFGLVSTAADASSFRSLGKTVGTVLGVLLQVGAYVIHYALMPLTLVIKTLAVVVRAAVWVGKVIVGSLVMAGKFIGKFLLPVRMLGQAFVSAGKIIYSVWQILTGDVSLLDGLKAIGGAVFNFLTTPFRWARDVVAGVFGFIRDTFTVIGGFFTTAAARIGEAILNLPVIATLRQMLATVRDLFAGDTTFLEAGKRLIMTLGEGIVSMATYPYRKVKEVLGRIRNLLPFSDAQEGPLATLTASGAALLKTFAQGIAASAGLPGMAFGTAIKKLAPMLSSVGGALREKAQSVMSLVAAPFQGMQSLWGGLTERLKNAASSVLQKTGALAGPRMEASVAAAPKGPEASLWDRLKAAALRGVQAVQQRIPSLKVPVSNVDSQSSPLPLAQRILNGVLNLAPKVDMRLVPKALSAALLLTPVLAGAVPQPTATGPLVTPPIVAERSAQSAVPDSPLAGLQRLAVPETPALAAAPIERRVSPVLPDGLSTTITGDLRYAVPDVIDVPFSGEFLPRAPQDMSANIAGSIQPALPDSLGSTLALQPEIGGLPRLTADLGLNTMGPSLGPLRIPGNIEAGLPAIAPLGLNATLGEIPPPELQARIAASVPPLPPLPAMSAEIRGNLSTPPLETL
ncbi:phage tail tape measure protein, partial [bacterium]|nr:phage tail tape measure protein [bacterium]